MGTEHNNMPKWADNLPENVIPKRKTSNTGYNRDQEANIIEQVEELEKAVRYVKGSLDSFKARRASPQNFIGSHRTSATLVSASIEANQAEKDMVKANQPEVVKTKDDKAAVEEAVKIVDKLDETIQSNKPTLAVSNAKEKTRGTSLTR